MYVLVEAFVCMRIVYKYLYKIAIFYFEFRFYTYISSLLVVVFNIKCSIKQNIYFTIISPLFLFIFFRDDKWMNGHLDDDDDDGVHVYLYVLV